MKVLIPFTLDVKKTNVQKIIHANQGEGLDRKLIITLVSGSEPLILDSENQSVQFVANKPDGTTIYNSTAIKDGKVIIYLTSQTTAAVGDVDCQLEVVSTDEGSVGSGVVYSAKFTIAVEEALYDAETVQSSNEFTELVQLIQTAGKGKVYTGTTTPGTDPENYPLIKEDDVYLKIESNSVTVYEASSVSTTVTWSDIFKVYLDSYIDDNLAKINRVFNSKTGDVKQEYIDLEVAAFTSGRTKNNNAVGSEFVSESSTTWKYTTVEVGDYKDFKIQFRSPASTYSKYIVGVDANGIVTEIHGESTPDAATVQTVEFTCLATTKTLYISDLASNLSANFYVKEKEYISLQEQTNNLNELIDTIDGQVNDLEEEDVNLNVDIRKINNKIGTVKEEYVKLEITAFTSGRAKNSSTDTAVGKELQIESSTNWKYTTVEVGDYKKYKIIFSSTTSDYAYYIVGVNANGIITEIHGEATPSGSTTQTVEFTCLSSTVALVISGYALNTSTVFSANEKRYVSLQSQEEDLQEQINTLQTLTPAITAINHKIGTVKTRYVELEITDFTSGRVKSSVSTTYVGATLQTENSTTWKYTTINIGDYNDYKIVIRSTRGDYYPYIVGVDSNNIITEIHGEATPSEATTQTIEFTCLPDTVALIVSGYGLDESPYFSANEKQYISLQEQIESIEDRLEYLENNVVYEVSVANFNTATFDNMNNTRSLSLYL